jgi:hypothetical protein
MARRHSVLTAALPRRWDRLIPRLCFVLPKIDAMMWWRCW